MAIKFAVTKANRNVLTATDPNDFIFDSTLNTFKILATGRVLGQTVSGTPTTVNVAHGLGFTPVVLAFLKFPDGMVYLPNSYQSLENTSESRAWEVHVDGTNIQFRLYKISGSNYTVSIKYFVFEAPI